MFEALTRALREPRRVSGDRKRDTVKLAALAALFAAIDISLILSDRPTGDLLGSRVNLAVQLLVDCSLPLLARFPRAITGLALAVTVVMLGFDTYDPGFLVPTDSVSPVTVPRAVPIVIIVLVLREERRTALCVAAVFAVLAGRLWHPLWEITPFGLLSTIGPALGALYFDARKQLMQSLRDRAERAERERHLLAEQARAEERRRLAAEMHDVVTHRLSLIVLHAGALQLSSGEQAVQHAAEDIRESGTHALRELRDLVGVLRSDRTDNDGNGTGLITRPAEQAPAPDIHELVAASESVGVAVHLHVDGDPEQVSPTVARTAFRIVQEALTNVRKHAPGARTTVDLRYDKQGVRIAVSNAAPTGTPDPVLANSGSGAGLTGLEQRVELVGGSLRSGPTGDGGFTVSAILPAYVATTESR